MIVQIKANDRIPADLLVLSSSDADGHTFIRTDQLDGETDWKLRKAVKLTHPQTDSLIEMRACCKCEPPSASIYSFKGKISVEREEGKVREALSLENVIWASTVLACNPIWGLVIYCGKDTRISLNSKLPTSKIGKFDREMDTLAKMLFMIMVLLTSVVTFFSEPVLDIRGISVSFIRYLVLLSNIIPVPSILISRSQCESTWSSRNWCIRYESTATNRSKELLLETRAFRKSWAG
jgi:phospholipid-translocating ATPase